MTTPDVTELESTLLADVSAAEPPSKDRVEEVISRGLEWLAGQLEHYREHTRRGETLRPRIQPEGLRLHGLKA